MRGKSPNQNNMPHMIVASGQQPDERRHYETRVNEPRSKKSPRLLQSQGHALNKYKTVQNFKTSLQDNRSKASLRVHPEQLTSVLHRYTEPEQLPAADLLIQKLDMVSRTKSAERLKQSLSRARDGDVGSKSKQLKDPMADANALFTQMGTEEDQHREQMARNATL